MSRSNRPGALRLLPLAIAIACGVFLALLCTSKPAEAAGVGGNLAAVIQADVAQHGPASLAGSLPSDVTAQTAHRTNVSRHADPHVSARAAQPHQSHWTPASNASQGATSTTPAQTQQSNQVRPQGNPANVGNQGNPAVPSHQSNGASSAISAGQLGANQAGVPASTITSASGQGSTSRTASTGGDAGASAGSGASTAQGESTGQGQHAGDRANATGTSQSGVVVALPKASSHVPALPAASFTSTTATAPAAATATKTTDPVGQVASSVAPPASSSMPGTCLAATLNAVLGAQPPAVANTACGPATVPSLPSSSTLSHATGTPASTDAGTPRLSSAPGGATLGSLGSTGATPETITTLVAPSTDAVAGARTKDAVQTRGATVTHTQHAATRHVNGLHHPAADPVQPAPPPPNQDTQRVPVSPPASPDTNPDTLQAGASSALSFPAAVLPDLALLLPPWRAPTVLALAVPSGITLPSAAPSG